MSLPSDYVRRFIPDFGNFPGLEIEVLLYADHAITELIQYDMFNDGARPNVVALKGPQLEQLYQTLGSLVKELKNAQEK